MQFRMNLSFLDCLIPPAQGTLPMYLHPPGEAAYIPCKHQVWFLLCLVGNLPAEVSCQLYCGTPRTLSLFLLFTIPCMSCYCKQNPSSSPVLLCLWLSLQSLKMPLLAQMLTLLLRKCRFFFPASGTLTLLSSTSHSVLIIWLLLLIGQPEPHLHSQPRVLMYHCSRPHLVHDQLPTVSPYNPPRCFQKQGIQFSTGINNSHSHLLYPQSSLILTLFQRLCYKASSPLT